MYNMPLERKRGKLKIMLDQFIRKQKKKKEEESGA